MSPGSAVAERRPTLSGPLFFPLEADADDEDIPSVPIPAMPVRPAVAVATSISSSEQQPHQQPQQQQQCRTSCNMCKHSITCSTLGDGGDNDDVDSTTACNTTDGDDSDGDHDDFVDAPPFGPSHHAAFALHSCIKGSRQFPLSRFHRAVVMYEDHPEAHVVRTHYDSNHSKDASRHSHSRFALASNIPSCHQRRIKERKADPLGYRARAITRATTLSMLFG